MARWQTLPLLFEDVHYVRNLIKDGEPEIQAELMRKYAMTWVDTSDTCDWSHRADNEGRRAANTWIRREVERLRHQEPESVRRYREIVRQGPPKCCHTCDRYDKSGSCTKFSMEPPEDFAARDGACPEWVMNIPF